ncbi:pyruvate dehydrogenase (acetyl-transferring) E1 component subunit alpha [Vicingus serpentipes]|jgi:pyruvate dehydrogenase E1 component subunit alpha|uniref:Pyruvate dehydrogenase E1 component subunit alpha n=1 Tax=Vicingus serpentipes TaxID=1926625 RepID=A0A5C6RY15_9FLAO|nr:pyruvate dehydrogenase (acetyl-transferring) E1 component subunit alpha [Vicingus serpentipes]TXB66739.1 pyruvate dehydrogenase (acetyl-transferring) E1 component subunit alpha [Vicingus serpentipes]
MAKNNKFSKEQYLSWYESMLLMRKFEEKLSQLYIQRKFGGFLHLYIGQEAVVAGAVSATTIDDKMITAYRCHAHPLGRGTDPKYMMAELYGKTTGLSKGKGGSMHMFDVSKNVFGGHGIVGGQIPLGTGLAFADKYKGNNFVTMCSMGDGAVRQGALHEAFNMAMTWKIPVIYIIENNQYAMGTSVERTSNVTDLYKLGLSYDMPGEPVDAMNVEDVHNAIAKAAKHCREGKGPYLLEMITYRFKGHSMSDPRKYRTKEEEAKYQSEDPIEKVLATIKKNKYATDKQIDAIGAKIKKQIEDAIKFAEDSPLPEPEAMYEDIYAEPNYPFIKD